VYLTVVFCFQNALKLTYEHLQFQKFFRGLYPGLPLKGEGEGKERGIGGEGMELREVRKELGREGKEWGGMEGEGWVIREGADGEKRKGREGRKGREEEKGKGGPRKGLRPGPRDA
jgi:hypothetical protein